MNLILAVSSVGVSPGSVTGGKNVNVTVTLSGAAPAGGSAVTLTGSNSAFPTAYVMVAAGAVSQSFSLPTAAVSRSTAVTITASYNSSSATSPVLMVNAAAAMPPTGRATFLKTDNSTAGTWTSAYGGDGFMVMGDTSITPAYVTVAPSGISNWVWVASTSDPRAVQKASSHSDRIAAAWYATGSFTIDLNFTDAKAHQVAAYLLDWSGNNGRSERVEVLDANNTVLDTRAATAFSGGQYLVWSLSGHVLLRFTNAGPLNAVISGLFFGAALNSVNSADSIISPASGSTLSGPPVNICWTNNGNYLHWLDVGTAAGSGDLYGGYQPIGATCKSIANILGNGSAVYARIYSSINGAWQAVAGSSATYTAPLRTFSPPDGTVFTASTVTFSWAPIAGASSYWLDVGPFQGNGSIFAGSQSATTLTVGNITPTGIPIWARLWAFYAGAWHVQGDHSYTACSGCVSTIATPTPSTALAGSSAQFCWTPTAGADHYWLDVGTAAGTGNLYGADQGTATCRTVSGLPTSGIIYVQLLTHMGADWKPPIRYQYLGANSLAQITSPAPNSVLASSTVTFSWTAPPGATGYWLDVGTSLGSGALYGASQGTATSHTVSGIPAGTIWVRLWTRFGAMAVPRDFQYTH